MGGWRSGAADIIPGVDQTLARLRVAARRVGARGRA